MAPVWLKPQTQSPPDSGGNAAHPAQHNSLGHSVICFEYPADSRPAEQPRIRLKFASVDIGLLRYVTPGTRSFANEGY